MSERRGAAVSAPQGDSGASGRSTVHVVGAGIAGLSAAVTAAKAGYAVAVYEAAPQAGGRCRSFEDRDLGCRIDNGNHLVMTANLHALQMLERVGVAAAEVFEGADRPATFPFFDLGTGERWTVRPNAGRLPWWVFRAERRIPGTRPADYLHGWRVLAGRARTIGDAVDPAHPLYARFWEPLTLAVLNETPERADAGLMRTVLLATFARGERWCRPLIARHGLEDALVAPVVRWLERAGVPLRLKARLRRIDHAEGRASALVFNDATVPLGPDDRVILATPASVAGGLVPDLIVPEEGAPILNAHFALSEPVAAPGAPRFVGLIGSLAQWVFLRDSIASVTVSAADAVIDQPADVLAARLWPEVARALGRPASPIPPWRIIKEKRATFFQTPDNLLKRPAPRTAFGNVVLAGDWTATGLPATIDGAAKSGHTAAALLGAGGFAAQRADTKLQQRWANRGPRLVSGSSHGVPVD